jgi:hypothetical protein
MIGSSVVFVVKRSKVEQIVNKTGIMVAGVWHRVEAFTSVGPESNCELCCVWGHIENKYGNKPKCGNYSGNHRTTDHECNVLGCTANHGSLFAHMLEKCPNCKGNHIAFSSRCAKKSEAARAARQCRRMGTAGPAPASKATHTATVTNRVVLGHRPRGGGAADGGRAEGEREMADAEEEEATGEARDVKMTEAEIATTTATETETEAGALATHD